MGLFKRIVGLFKRKEEKSLFDNLGDFGMFVNAFSGGGNTGNVFPEDDAIDFRNGAKHIPDQVTTARQSGERVTFYPSEHKWKMPDGSFVS